MAGIEEKGVATWKTKDNIDTFQLKKEGKGVVKDKSNVGTNQQSSHVLQYAAAKLKFLLAPTLNTAVSLPAYQAESVASPEVTSIDDPWIGASEALEVLSLTAMRSARMAPFE